MKRPQKCKNYLIIKNMLLTNFRLWTGWPLVVINIIITHADWLTEWLNEERLECGSVVTEREREREMCVHATLFHYFSLSLFLFLTLSFSFSLSLFLSPLFPSFSLSLFPSLSLSLTGEHGAHTQGARYLKFVHGTSSLAEREREREREGEREKERESEWDWGIERRENCYFYL